ncbi:XRE family transcriptional regulator [Rhodovarius crocodyli]|uniref:XRE family transcriptional regulator n=1 Tax=Rhodovarius crocodyli TaxID=1979269 RepID=A0A437MC60_9PROT|nr:helix-turn-helix transcriptional regulator [Rhodovarius crocodyli]RVT95222.1 XRE family transcriptional regulator [Rhodovarius crocodyli]
MTLDEYRAREGLSYEALAERLGFAGPNAARTVHRYAGGERIPRPDAMRRIMEATGGKVTPTDFYAAARESA